MSRLCFLSVILGLVGQSLAACPAGYLEAQGTCLKFSTDSKTYEDARATCQADGARLVVVKTAGLDAFLGDTIKNSYNGDTWIGLDDLNSPTHQFVWSDGSTLTASDYSNWDGVQPDNPDTEQCVEIRVEYSYNWNNHLCSELKHYVCEKAVLDDCAGDKDEYKLCVESAITTCAAQLGISSRHDNRVRRALEEYLPREESNNLTAALTVAGVGVLAVVAMGALYVIQKKRLAA
ncbi:PREDICTED: CD209 antigen-like protein E [Branchiostoma belcheri]|uniref:CD209 antigen-like protein E n=1 Tax=Branchiostoma belcheri TaxID=7741 RepID=A0A6P4YDD6_BRABE|nr:PREDICTED: CD209 antigen-like protein E [Branchiostoma belcheri]